MQEVSLLKLGFIGVSIEQFAGNVKLRPLRSGENTGVLHPTRWVSGMEQSAPALRTPTNISSKITKLRHSSSGLL